MVFRYKITRCVYERLDHILHGPGVGYRVVIQYYKPNANIFKWRHFKSNRLCYVMNKIGQYTIDNSEDLFRSLNKYESIGEIMSKYIKKILEDKDYAELVNQIEDNIDKFVLSKNWNTIEIKENE